MHTSIQTIGRRLLPAAIALVCACGGDAEPSTPAEPSPTDTSQEAVALPTGDTASSGETATADTGSTADTALMPTGSTGDTATLTSWQKVVAGRSATCGIDQDGAVRCLSDGRMTLPTPPAGAYVELAVAFGTACAIDGAGAIACWGCDYVSDMCVPPTDTGYEQLAAGTDTLCGRKGDGTVTCWGYGSGPPALAEFTDFDMAVTGFAGLRPDGSLGFAGEESPDGFTGSGYVEVGTGRSFVCALDPAGDNDCSEFAPAGLPASGLSQIDGMSDTFCWLDVDGHVGCWPDARNPTLARDGFDPTTTEFASVSAGDRHACGTTVDGEAWCWPAGQVFTDWPVRP